jgi:hypothetical protein
MQLIKAMVSRCLIVPRQNGTLEEQLERVVEEEVDYLRMSIGTGQSAGEQCL